MELRDYLRVLRKRWMVIVLVTVLGAGIAAALTELNHKTYRAHAESFVSLTSAATSEPNSTIQQASQFTMQRVASYTHTAKSPQVLDPVISSLHLSISTNQLAAKVSASNPTNTILLELYVTDRDAARSARIANAVADSMASTIEQLEAPRSGGPSPVKVTVIRPATTPTGPISPRPKLNIALGVILGLVVGVGIAVLREQLDTSVKSPEDVQKITRARPIGLVGRINTGSEGPLVALRPRAAEAEAFRAIRTNLQFVDVDHPATRIVVTSAIAEEGKTLTACNLAIALAQAGTRVCLVEADLRRPNVASYLGIDGASGLTNVLAGQQELSDVLVDWHDGLLTVLAAGTIPPDPSELLASENMRALLDDLSARFDIVVLDAPPLLPVTDAAVVASQADGAVLVARYGHVSRDQLSQALETLRLAGARVLGTVLTFIPRRGVDWHATYHYEYETTAQTSGSARVRKGRRLRRKVSETAEPGAPATAAEVTEAVEQAEVTSPANERR